MKEKVQDILLILLGGSIMGFALDFFLVPSQVTAGGVSGVSTVLYYLFNLPIGLMVLVLNIPIFILGFITFNSRFLITSLIGTVALSVSAQFFELEIFRSFQPISNDMLLCSVFGGSIYGVGLGIAMRSGGTTGGTDILSLVLKKWFPSMSVGQFIIAIDGIVILAAGLAFQRLDTILYSIVMLFVCSYVLDTMLEGVNFAKIVYVISDHNKEIAEMIASELNRGSTALSGFSMYSGKNRDVLMCVMRKYQLPPLKKMVMNIYEGAVVIVTDAKEVIGQGFRIRNKLI